ncbi:MAG: MFS transporter [Nitratireductor sp.]
MRSLFPTPRVAVSILFLLNGFIVGNWAPKLPFLFERLGISEATLGGLILFFGLGGLIVFPTCGVLLSKFGSRSTTLTFALIICFAFPALTYSSNLYAIGFVMFLMGINLIGMDICMNANVVVSEQKTKLSFMSSCHGFWSVGGIVGALSGGAILDNFGIYTHAYFVTIFCITCFAIAWPILQTDTQSVEQKAEKLQFPKNPTLYILGLITFLAIVPEGAVIDWSALYYISELDASATMAGYAFAALSTTMAIIRFSGDVLCTKFGNINVMRASAIISAVGMVFAGQATSILFATIGFALAGIGIANLVPIVFSVAGRQKDVKMGISIATVGFTASVGLMGAPAALGYAAEYMSFSTIYTLSAICFVIIYFLSPVVGNADESGK